jgi:hypothetical protein
MFLVNCNTFPRVETAFGTAALLGRRRTSASTFSMNSLILSIDPEMRDRSIFILAGTALPFLSVRSKLASSKSRLQHECTHIVNIVLTIFEQVYDLPFMLSDETIEQI